MKTDAAKVSAVLIEPLLEYRHAMRAWGVLTGFDAVFHPVAGAFDKDGFGVVEQTVEHG